LTGDPEGYAKEGYGYKHLSLHRSPVAEPRGRLVSPGTRETVKQHSVNEASLRELCERNPKEGLYYWQL